MFSTMLSLFVMQPRQSSAPYSKRILTPCTRKRLKESLGLFQISNRYMVQKKKERLELGKLEIKSNQKLSHFLHESALTLRLHNNKFHMDLPVDNGWDLEKNA